MDTVGLYLHRRVSGLWNRAGGEGKLCSDGFLGIAQMKALALQPMWMVFCRVPCDWDSVRESCSVFELHPSIRLKTKANQENLWLKVLVTIRCVDLAVFSKKQQPRLAC